MNDEHTDHMPTPGDFRRADERVESVKPLQKPQPGDRLRMARGTIDAVLAGELPASDARRSLLCAALAVVPQRKDSDDGVADLLAAALTERLGTASSSAVFNMKHAATSEMERRAKKAERRRAAGTHLPVNKDTI